MSLTACRWAALLLIASSALPLGAAEFCTEPPPGSPGDFACRGALATGFGGIVVFERGVATETLLGPR